MQRYRLLLRPSLALAAIVTTILLLSVLLYGLSYEHTGPVTIGFPGTPVYRGGHVALNVSLASNRPFPLPVEAGLLPLDFSNGSHPVYVLVDPSLPALFGTTSEAQGLVDTLGTELSNIGSTTSVGTLTAPQLPSFFSGNRSATLIVANYGILPDPLLSNSSGSLGGWMDAGGRLIWAGGPLGYYATNANGSVPNGGAGGPGWFGQIHLLGFPLTDPPANWSAGNLTGNLSVPVPSSGTPPIPGLTLSEPNNGSSSSNLPIPAPWPGPMTGGNESGFGAGLGLQYNGTEYGANVTELRAHGGLSLGYLTPPGSDGASPRTSLAYLPVGNGSLFYFGGAVFDPLGNFVPEGGVRLAFDIAQLIAFPFTPASGPVFVEYLNLSAYQSTSVEIAANDTAPAIGLVLQSDVSTSVLFEITRQLVGPGLNDTAPAGTAAG